MSKFTAEEKLSAVLTYLKGTVGYRTLALELGIEPKAFHYWIKRYQYHGVEAFTTTYTSFTVAFKLDVLKYMNDQGTSIRETAAIFNLSTPAVLLSWKKRMDNGGQDALDSKKKGRPSMKKDSAKQTKPTYPENSVEALRERIKYLEMENDYLKKLNALVQSKEKSPNKTKR